VGALLTLRRTSPREEFPHDPRAGIEVACFDDRYALENARAAKKRGGAFLGSWAGGAAAILTPDGHDFCLRQVTTAFAAHPFRDVTFTAHVGCWKIGDVLKTMGTFAPWFNEPVQPHDVGFLLRLGQAAAREVHPAFASRFGDQVAESIRTHVLVYDLYRTRWRQVRSRVIAAA
jgi:hypothetical protein